MELLLTARKYMQLARNDSLFEAVTMNVLSAKLIISACAGPASTSFSIVATL